MIFAILGGVFFPVVIPIGILVYWIYSIMKIPLGTFDEKESMSKKNGNEVSKSNEIKSKFKVGDIITGVSGNPGDYQTVYEGCVCRVLNIVNNKKIKVILIDHKDKEAHDLGSIHVVSAKNFKLIKKPTKKKG